MSNAAIVVGTDGSATAARAVGRAGELAAALEAPLHLVMCCEPLATMAVSVAGAPFGAMMSVDHDPHDQAQAVVDRAREDLRQHGVEAEAHVRDGDPADSLISIAEDVGAQMIVVGNRGMRGAARVLGSVPNRISHRARCAVLIVPTAD